jgi:radical S-adenosyl methionine domain-containing protein 2
MARRFNADFTSLNTRYAKWGLYYFRRLKMEGYVINLHLLERCNFRCKHCFAHFGTDKRLGVTEWKAIIENILKKTQVKRFNLAGGEPLLYEGLDEIIEYIHRRGVDVSIITNGYMLSPDRVRDFSGMLSMIGLSIDAVQEDTLVAIGRCTENRETLSSERCIAICQSIKEQKIMLKINTVVSMLNINEDMSSFIQITCPDRWKLIKMKPFDNGNIGNVDLSISDTNYKIFCARYSDIPHLQEPELANAYIMVDTSGNLVGNGTERYIPVANLLEDDFADSFKQFPFNKNLYGKRYER